MKQWLDDLVGYFFAIKKDAAALTSSIASCLMWMTSGALLAFVGTVAFPVALLCAAPIAIFIAGFFVWRKERWINDRQELYLHIRNTIQEGERQLARFDSRETNDGRAALVTTASLSRWHDDTLESFRKAKVKIRDQFADLGNFGTRPDHDLGIDGVAGGRAQAVELLKRLHALADSMHFNWNPSSP